MNWHRHLRLEWGLAILAVLNGDWLAISIYTFYVIFLAIVLFFLYSRLVLILFWLHVKLLVLWIPDSGAISMHGLDQFILSVGFKVI